MKINWDYIAGFFDGEGSVQFKWYPKSGTKGVVITIAQSSENSSVIPLIKSFLEENNIERIHYYVSNYTDKRGYKRQPLHMLRITNKWDAQKFLEAIKDRVISKKDDVTETLERIKTLKRHTRVFTDEEKEKIITLFKEGKNIHEIANIIGCGAVKINKFLLSLDNYQQIKEEKWRKIGVDRSTLPEEQKRKCISLYQSGLSGKDIAEKLNISYHKVRHLLRKAKVTRKPGETLHFQNYNKKIKPIEDKLIQNYLKGKSVEKLSKKYKVSTNQIYSFLREKRILRPNWYMIAHRGKI